MFMAATKTHQHAMRSGKFLQHNKATPRQECSEHPGDSAAKSVLENYRHISNFISCIVLGNSFKQVRSQTYERASAPYRQCLQPAG